MEIDNKESAGRLWWPLDWADEVMPPPRSTPDEFIIDAGGHFYLGYPLDDLSIPEYERRYFSRHVESGDIVDFICSDELGEIEITINPDGSFTTDGVVPDRATHFWSRGDADSLAFSLEKFVSFYRENENEPPGAPETLTVSMKWWSDALPHKLVPTFGGGKVTMKFEAVSSAEAKQ